MFLKYWPKNTNVSPEVSEYTYRTRVFNLYSAGIDFRRQNLTSKIDPHTVKVNIFIMTLDP